MAQLLAGRYELGERLGVGGMAEVVRGLDVRLRRPVAIKLVPTDRVDAATRERFRREARTSAGFSHPHAVTTYDAGEDAGWLYLVMELVEGRTLAERLAADGPLAAEDAVAVTSSVLDALGAAHDAGLVHRDVKPGNVLLGDDGTVKLADFGIARRFDDVTHELTAAGTFIGTARYAAPEQLAGEPGTPASDLYSTGVVLYEMLAGRPPFDGDSAVAIAMAHHHAPVPDVRRLAPAVPSSVAAAVSRAMAKDPAARFPSARAMREALEARTTVAPAVPPAPTAPLPTTLIAPAPAVAATQRRRPRRQRWWWLAAAVLVLVAVAALVAVAGDGSPGSGGASTTPGSVGPIATTPPTVPGAVPATVAPTAAPATAPTSAPPTSPAGAPPTAPPATDVPRSVEELAALIAADPERFGNRAGQVVTALERIDGRGGDDARRAGQLLDRARAWVDEGQLEPAAMPLLEAVLAPLAAGAGGEGGEGDEDRGDEDRGDDD